MWLLDVNVPAQVIPLLESVGKVVKRSDRLGWGELRNGQLVQAAVDNGFSCLLTRDKLFEESASQTLKKNPEFCVILLTIAQATAPKYLSEFKIALQQAPIYPQRGRMLRWPG